MIQTLVVETVPKETKELLKRCLPMLVKLGDFIGNGKNDERCILISEIKRCISND